MRAADRKRGWQLVEKALQAYGITDPARTESHLRGCNLDRTISALTLDVGATVSVWVRDGERPGKYGAPQGEDPRKLGIIIEGRHREDFRVMRALTVICSTAATFPAGVVNKVGGEGGERSTCFLLIG